MLVMIQRLVHQTGLVLDVRQVELIPIVVLLEPDGVAHPLDRPALLIGTQAEQGPLEGREGRSLGADVVGLAFEIRPIPTRRLSRRALAVIAGALQARPAAPAMAPWARRTPGRCRRSRRASRSPAPSGDARASFPGSGSVDDRNSSRVAIQKNKSSLTSIWSRSRPRRVEWLEDVVQLASSRASSAHRRGRTRPGARPRPRSTATPVQEQAESQPLGGLEERIGIAAGPGEPLGEFSLLEGPGQHLVEVRAEIQVPQLAADRLDRGGQGPATSRDISGDPDCRSVRSARWWRRIASWLRRTRRCRTTSSPLSSSFWASLAFVNPVEEDADRREEDGDERDQDRRKPWRAAADGVGTSRVTRLVHGSRE